MKRKEIKKRLDCAIKKFYQTRVGTPETVKEKLKLAVCLWESFESGVFLERMLLMILFKENCEEDVENSMYFMNFLESILHEIKENKTHTMEVVNFIDKMYDKIKENNSDAQLDLACEFFHCDD